MGIIQQAKDQVHQQIIEQVNDIASMVADLSNLIEDEQIDNENEDVFYILDKISSLLSSVAQQIDL